MAEKTQAAAAEIPVAAETKAAEVQETPLQKAMREAGVSTVAELQAKQAADRAGVPYVPVKQEDGDAVSAAPPELKNPRGKPPKKNRTPIPDDGGPLAEAAKRMGVDSMEELQQKQAQERNLTQPKSALPEGAAPVPLADVDLEQLSTEIRQLETDAAELSSKVARAQKAISDKQALIDQKRAQLLALTTESVAQGNQNYLEGVKKQMIERHTAAGMVRQAVVDSGAARFVDVDRLGLGRSPADIAIAQRHLAERRAQSQQALEATVGKPPQR